MSADPGRDAAVQLCRRATIFIGAALLIAAIGWLMIEPADRGLPAAGVCLFAGLWLAMSGWTVMKTF